MAENLDLEQIRSMVRSLAQSCALVVQKVTDLADHVEPREAGGRGHELLENLLGGRPLDADAMFGKLIVDAGAKTITYRGCSCCLGNTRMIARLARAQINSFHSTG